MEGEDQWQSSRTCSRTGSAHPWPWRGIAVVAPLAVPVLGAVAVRVLKAAIKSGALAYGYGYWATGGTAAYVEDIYREARAELEGPPRKRRQ
jgi:hypothetical protein